MTTRFEDEDAAYQLPVCSHPEHNPPSYIVIPPGKVMVHTCPNCGVTRRIHSTNVTFRASNSSSDFREQPRETQASYFGHK